jgi:signal transduction histidine kinase
VSEQGNNTSRLITTEPRKEASGARDQTLAPIHWWKKANNVRRVTAWFVCFGSVALATLLRTWMDPVLNDHHPFTLYFGAVALSAWYGGLRPGIVAIVLSYFAADWFFITPRFELNWPRENLDEFLALIAFLFSGFAIAITTNIMRRALRQAQQKQLELEREIVEREKAEEALREAQVLLRRHAALLEERVTDRTMYLRETMLSLEGVCYHLAHDLRAPLRALDGYTNLLLRECGTSLDVVGQGYAGKIVQAAKRMDILIQGLMEYGRLGHEEFPMQPVNLRHILEAVLGEVISEENQAKITLGDWWPEVLANEALLHTILLNLLGNSMKFVKPGTQPIIHMWLENRGSWVRFWVEDNGIGFPMEYSDKLFGIFQRLHPSESYPGTGIGLAIVAKAVARMKGRVGVESQPNKGSRFWFELMLFPVNVPKNTNYELTKPAPALVTS